MMCKYAACLLLITLNALASAPDVQLASSYQEQPISEYLISEKLDGIRAIWCDGKLVTRNGNEIHAPSWFTQNWPSVWLDGELWTKRNDFENIASIVLDSKPDEIKWRSVRYYVFDMPNNKLPFKTRYKNYVDLTKTLNHPHMRAVEQQTFPTWSELNVYHQTLVSQGAEGIMLHKKNAYFAIGKSNHLLKLKSVQEDDAIVIEYTDGKGKHKGKVGALVVRGFNGLEFKIGSGLSDKLRSSPPAIGSTIRFRYNGLTKYGKPRFARFIGVTQNQPKRSDK